MLKCSESQQQFLDMTAQAAGKARLRAQEADKLGLKTLAREWDYFSTAFETAIERQLRVFEIAGEMEETFFFADRQGGLEAWICNRNNDSFFWVRSKLAGRWTTVVAFVRAFTPARLSEKEAQETKGLPFL